MIDLSDKLEYSPQLPINREAVLIFTEFIVNLDYSFLAVNRLDFIYGQYDRRFNK
jgi:hypothetical protein